MINEAKHMNKWQQEQLEYFKRYLGTFDRGSHEYDMILKGIRELEKHA